MTRVLAGANLPLALSRLDLKTVLSNPPPKREWLIQDILPTHSIILLAGDAGIGKTSLIYALTLALATGRNILGRSTTPHRILYFDEENSRPDCYQYLTCTWAGIKGDVDLATKNFRFEHFTLAEVLSDPFPPMKAIIKEHRPDLIVIDTLTPSCRIPDENSNAEAARALQKLRYAISEAPESRTLLLITHAKQNQDTKEWDIRGAKGLKGWTDGTIIHKPAMGSKWRKDGLRKTALEFKKMRAFGNRADLVINPRWIKEKNGPIVFEIG